MLPGEADPTVDLDVELGVLIRARYGQHGGHCCRIRELVATGGRGPGSVPYGRRGQFGRHQHVGAVVLHGLVGADGTPELLADLGVPAGHVGAFVCDARGFGGEQQPGQVDQNLSGTGQLRRLRPVKADPGRTAGRIEVGRDLDGHLAGSALDDDHVIAHRDEQQVGQTSAEDHTGRAVCGTVPDLHSPSESHGPDGGAVDQAGQEAALYV